MVGLRVEVAGFDHLGVLQALGPHPERRTRFSVKAENRGVAVTEAVSHLRLTDSCITQLRAQGPSRTCNESTEEGEGLAQDHLGVLQALDPHSEHARNVQRFRGGLVSKANRLLYHSTLS